jgi:hypothetical protein
MCLSWSRAPGSSNPPASASRGAGTISVLHHARVLRTFSIRYFQLFPQALQAGPGTAPQTQFSPGIRPTRHRRRSSDPQDDWCEASSDTNSPVLSGFQVLSTDIEERELIEVPLRNCKCSRYRALPAEPQSKLQGWRRWCQVKRVAKDGQHGQIDSR